MTTIMMVLVVVATDDADVVVVNKNDNDDRGYDVLTLVSNTCSLFSLRILFHAALARHGCLDHCTRIISVHLSTSI